MLGAAAAGEGGGQFDFQMNQECAGACKQQGAGGGVLDGAAAQGQHQVVAFGEARDGLMLALAEDLLALTREDLGNGDSGFGFDHVVDIHESPVQARGYQRTNRSLARAHESSEDDATGGWLGLRLSCH